jgi:hypothetical protein
MKRLLMSLMLGCVVALGGCAAPSNKAELMSQEERRFDWVVAAPIDKVFERYKDFAHEEFAGGDFLWSGGLRVAAFYYGDRAEVGLRMEGNPLTKATYLQISLSKEGEGTRATIWYYNRFWRDHALKFRGLMPLLADK